MGAKSKKELRDKRNITWRNLFLSSSRYTPFQLTIHFQSSSCAVDPRHLYPFSLWSLVFLLFLKRSTSVYVIEWTFLACSSCLCQSFRCTAPYLSVSHKSFTVCLFEHVMLYIAFHRQISVRISLSLIKLDVKRVEYTALCAGKVRYPNHWLRIPVEEVNVCSNTHLFRLSNLIRRIVTSWITRLHEFSLPRHIMRCQHTIFSPASSSSAYPCVLRTVHSYYHHCSRMYVHIHTVCAVSTVSDVKVGRFFIPHATRDP